MKTLFEHYIGLLGYRLTQPEKEIERIQSLSPGDYRKWRDEQRWQIARYHYEHNAFYRRKVGKHFPERWEDLPVLEKSDYQDNIEKLLSAGYDRKNTYISNTSGSSGHPFFFAKNKESHAMDWAMIKRLYGLHGLKLNAKQARFYGIPLEKWAYRREKVKDLVMNRVRFPVFDLSDEVLAQFVDKFRRTKFELIYGYTNSQVLFARYLIKQGIVLKDVCPSLLKCISTSEVLTPEDRNALSDGFGVDVINEYGVSEVGGIVAFERHDSRWVLSHETQFVEVLNEENRPLPAGQKGNICITDLDNLAMPFIRYNVGDIGVICVDGNESSNQCLQSLLGRTNDNVTLPSGKVSPGLTFYYVSRSILESSGVLKEFIIRQTALDSFVFDVVTERDLYESEVKEIESKMDLYLEPGLNLSINKVPFIERPESGKIRHFYSEIA